jgi:hypothetical protein
LGEESFEISQERRKLIPQVILEEKLLAGKWTVTEKGHLFNHWNNKELDSLIDLLRPDHHCSKMVAEGVTLYFNDGEMVLSFDNDVDMHQFVADHNITCELDKTVTRKIEDLAAQKARLEALMEKFGGNEQRTDTGKAD